MAEAQLVEYIKKAREAGQADTQTKNLLLNNGWTDAEVADAFLTISQNSQQAQKPGPQPVEAQPQYKPAQQPVQQPASAQQPQPTQVQPVQQSKVQPQPQFQQQQASRPVASNMYPKNSSGKHILEAIITLILVLVVLGGAAGAYLLMSNIWNPPWNPFKPNPEKVIDSMLANLKNVKTFHAETKSQISVSEGSGSGVVAFSLKSDNDMTDAENPKLNFSFNADLTLPESEAPTASIDADIIVIGKNLYAKLNRLAMPAMARAPASDIASFQGKWIHIDKISAQGLAGIAGLSSEQIKLLQNSQAVSFSLPQIDPATLKGLFSFKKHLKDEIKNGQDAYHYLMAANKENIKVFLVNSVAQNDSTGLANAMISNFLESMGDIEFEVWIGKKDFLLYGYKMEKSLNLGDIYPGTASQVDVNIENTYFDYNKQLSIVAPQNAQNIEGMLESAMKTEIIRANMGQFISGAEQIFIANKSYSGLCKNGYVSAPRGAAYSPTFISAVRDIMARGASNPACFNIAQSYCISTQLPDGSTICVGPSGLGSVKCISGNTVCK